MKKKGEVIFFMDGRENIEKEGSQLVELFWEMLNRRLPKKCVSRIRATTLDIPICLKWNPMEALLNLEAVEEFIERAGPKHFKLKKIVKFFGTQELSMYEWVQGNPFNSLVGKGTMHRPKWADDILEELTEITKKIEDERLAYHVDINPGNVIYRGTENGLPVISIIDQYKDGQEWFRNGYI
ncbi:MAG: hypothetical protein D6769_00750 [Methanobacteriota archaeon]|nr:MAG: hypothetical protein D6769_00750 [Euryarchaeota archaeon]